MGVIYRGEFDSLSGVAWKIDIHDSLYSSTVNTFTPGSGGFQLSYKGITERTDPVLASTLTIPFIIRNATDNGFIEILMTAQEERYTVIVYKNSAIYWIGVMLPDEVQREDSSYPYEVELTFTDGLSRLKDLDYNNAGTAYTGRATLLAHILNTLNRCGTATHYGTSDTMLTTKINWYELYHSYTPARCPLVYTDLSHSVFYEYDEDGTVSYKSCYDVLETILRAFNARVLQSNGVYLIYQIQDMTIANGYYRSFSKSGTLLASGTNSLRVTVTDPIRKAGAVYRYMQPLREVSKTYKAATINSSDGNWLPVQSLYETYVPLIAEIVTGTSGTTIDFTGTFREWYIGPSAQQFYTQFSIFIKKTKTSDSSVQYLGGGPTVAPYWTATSTYYTYYTGSTGGGSFSRYSNYSITTPAITDDCTIEFKITGHLHFTPNGIAYTLPLTSNYSYDVYEPYAAVSYYDEESEEQEIRYKAVNSISGGGTVASTSRLELPDTIIGDGPNNYYIGRLRSYFAGNSTWYPSGDWWVRSSGTPIKLHQLSVDQALKGQRIPVLRIQASWISSSITASSSLVLGTAVYIPMTVTIEPERDEVTGEWFNCITP